MRARAAVADAEDVGQPDDTCLFIGMLMPAIRAIYFSPTRDDNSAREKAR